MKARWRILVAFSAVLVTAGAPALAQEAETAAPPEQNNVIGPPQLRDFSLPGTVTREAPATDQPAPARQTNTTPRQTQAQPAQASPRPAQASRQDSASSPRTVTAARDEPVRSDSGESAAEPSSPGPAEELATPSVSPSDDVALSPQPALVPATTDPVLEPSGAGFGMLPWLIAALALAGAAAWFFLRHRPRERYAAAGAGHMFDSLAREPAQPTPASAPQPRPARTPPPAAQPAAPKSAAGGVVSTRLRPWLELEFKPLRGVIDEEKAAIAFELTVFNSGSAPARDVLLEASLFNAGPMQDQQIRLFFENPVAKGDRIPVLPPLQKIAVNTAVFLSRDQIVPIEIEGRKLFVPLIAFNALYGWGRGTGQTSTSYLVGKGTNGEKLGPFRLDLGPRVFRNLDALEHEVRLRK